MINALEKRSGVASGAGRIALCPCKDWPPERRARQAARIRLAQPWRRSTGPRTEAGKTRSSKNAFKHGLRSQAHIERMRQARQRMRQVQHILRVSARNIAIVRAWLRARAAGLAPHTIVGLENVALGGLETVVYRQLSPNWYWPVRADADTFLAGISRNSGSQALAIGGAEAF